MNRPTHKKKYYIPGVFILILLFLQSHAISQTISTDCKENPDSPQKLFIFIGEFLDANRLPAHKNTNEGRFSVKYKIIERVCGDYQGDTIRFDVIGIEYDSSFMRSKYLLLVLTKDRTEDSDYVLWGPLFSDLFKTTDGRWAGPYMSEDQELTTLKRRKIKPQKISFANGSGYNTIGMTREEIDLAYPEPYYRIEKDKVIPVLGNYIPEILQRYKEGFLAEQNIYGTRDTVNPLGNSSMVIQDVQLAEILIPNYDSLNTSIQEALSKDPFNEVKIRELVKNYRAMGDSAGCSRFFGKLIKRYPDSPRAYLLKAQFLLPEELDDSSRILVLQQALKVDSNYYAASYELAFFFYYLFQKEPSNYYASNARKWLVKSCDINKTKRPFLKYPIIQLSLYLGDTAMVRTYQSIRDGAKTGLYRSYTENAHKWYFPIDPFLRTRERWKSTYEIDMLWELRSASRYIDWLSEELKYFREPVLRPDCKKNIYRLLWLRSFHAPVVISLEENKGDVTIYWKIARYNRKRGTQRLPLEAGKKLTMAAWNKFQKSLTTIDYWSMISRDYLSDGADGAIWLLEAAVNGRYHVTERTGYIYPKYTKCLSYLLSLTDLKLPKDEIY